MHEGVEAPGSLGLLFRNPCGWGVSDRWRGRQTSTPQKIGDTITGLCAHRQPVFDSVDLKANFFSVVKPQWQRVVRAKLELGREGVRRDHDHPNGRVRE